MIVPIEAVRDGDEQVIAAREPGKIGEPVIDIGVLSDVPSVESVVASTRIVSECELPRIRELLLTSNTPAPERATLRQLSGLAAFYAMHQASGHPLDLSGLPAQQMRKLAVNRWLAKDLAPLENMTGLERLTAHLFKDALDAISGMRNLKYLHVRGPAKGWAKLRNCTRLEEAHLIDVQIANLRRWNTWSQLRKFTLSGRGVRSLAGLESFQTLERLTLLNLDTSDLSALRKLPQLISLELRMADVVDLESVGSIHELRRFVIDSSRRDGELVRLAGLKPLASSSNLEEIVLLETCIEDGDLLPLATLQNLKKVRLGSMIAADVEKAGRSDRLDSA